MSDAVTIATPATPARRWLKRALWLVAVPVGLTLAAAGAAVGLLRSQSGSAWLLAQVPGLQVSGVQGALLGDELRAEQLVWSGPPGKLEVTALRLGGLQWAWRPAPDAWLGLHFAAIEAERVAWRSGAPRESKTAPTLPDTLRLPLQASAAIRIDRLQIDDLAPVQALSMSLRLATPQAPAHAVEGLALRWDLLTAAGQLQVGRDAPFAVTGALRLASVDGAPQPWQADLNAHGQLARIEVDAALEGATAPGRPPSSVSLKASLTPFEPWPLAALSARTEALDLAQLAAGLPQTRLGGQAELHSRALDQPMQARIQLHNAIPGRWDEKRLPLRRIDLALAATATEPGRVAIDRFDVLFADSADQTESAGAAGRWQGKGQWQGHQLDLQTQIEGLRPQRLDGRAAAMSVAGPLALTVTNLPAPDPAATPPKGAPALALTATLAGRLDDSPQAVKIELRARAQADAVQIERLRATAGKASADLQASARRSGKVWALETQGRVVDFDPLPWWPGAVDSPLRRGPHRLSGEWSLTLQTPPDVDKLEPLEALQRLGGRGLLVVRQSLLAGVPLAARVEVGQDGGDDARTRLNAELTLGGNRVKLEGRARPAGDGRDDRWQVEVDAPQLAALAPLARLHPAAKAWGPRQGRVTAQAEVAGRWPAMRIEGEADLTDLQVNALKLDQARSSWQAATGTDAPLAMKIELSGAQWQAQRIPWLQAELSGSWAAHRLRASAALPVQPAPALAQALGLESKPGTRIELRAQGQWQRQGDGSRWSGAVEQLAIDGWDGRSTTPLADPAAAWLGAQDLRATLDLTADGGVRRAQASAGRMKLAGGIGLRWDDVIYEPSAPGAPLALKATIETFPAAPLLARLQPAMGWEGDLRVGAQIDLRAGARFDADIVVQREGGDLRVRDATDAALALGLTDLRLALNAHDGQWLFTQALAGRALGELGGLVRVQGKAESRWPEAGAPIDGAIQMRVADLSIWGTWVPPGWRLGGSLVTSGRFAGSFGAPQVTGELRGRDIAVRNLLLGVNVHDGQVAVKLEGERARVERFTLRAGEGTLTITGDADLGAAPKARLALQAERFQLLGRIDRHLLASGRADLKLDKDALALTGRFKVDEGLFDASRGDAPTLDADVNVRRAGVTPPVATAPAPAQARRKIDVDLDIDLGDQLAVRGRGLKTRLAGQLKVTAPGGRLAVRGNVRTVEGTYRAYSQNLDISRGIVAFAGPVHNPRLDVLALRPKLDVEVGVAITGNAQSPRVRLYSDPEMSDTDKLSWLVLGRAPEGLGRDETALLQRAAVALLSGEEEGPTDGLIRKLGLDELSVRQKDGEVRDTVVTLGKQLSDRWYVGYERGVNATTGTWQLIYRVAQRFTLRAQSGLENAIDLIWVWRVP